MSDSPEYASSFFKRASIWVVPLPLLEAAMVLTWSSGFVGARFSIDYAPAFLVVFWRCVLVSIVLLPFAVAELRRSSLKTIVHYVGIGLLAMAGYLGGVVQGIALGVPAGLAALLADLLPIGTAILATTLLKQKLAAQVWFGLAIGLAGVMVVTWSALVSGSAPLWVYVLPFLGMMSLAAASIWQKHSDTFSSMSLIPNLWLQSTASAVVFGVVSSAQTGLTPIPTTGFWISVLWTAGIASLGGYGLYWLCLRRSSPTRVATVLYLSPAVTLIWACAMFGEPLSWLMAVGVAVSACGIWLVIRGENPREQLI
ncbi:DMT family transporter [Pseudomonas sp. S2_H01]